MRFVPKVYYFSKICQELKLHDGYLTKTWPRTCLCNKYRVHFCHYILLQKWRWRIDAVCQWSRCLCRRVANDVDLLWDPSRRLSATYSNRLTLLFVIILLGRSHFGRVFVTILFWQYVGTIPTLFIYLILWNRVYWLQVSRMYVCLLVVP